MTRGPVDTLESSRSVGDRQLHTVLAVEPTTTTQLVTHVALGATSGFASVIGREYPSPWVSNGDFQRSIACVVDTSKCRVSVGRTWMTWGSNEAQQTNVTNL